MLSVGMRRRRKLWVTRRRWWWRWVTWWRLRNLEMLKDKVKFGIHPGYVILDLANSVLKPLDPLPLLLESSIILSLERSHQGVRQPEEELFPELIYHSLVNCRYPWGSAWASVRVNFLIPCSRHRGN